MADLKQSASDSGVHSGSRLGPVQRFSRLWEGSAHPDLKQFLLEAGELNHLDMAAILLVDQCKRWRSGERVPAEIYLRDHLSSAVESEAAIDLIYQEFLLREELGEQPGFDEYERRFPNLAEQLRQQFEFHQAIESSDGAETSSTDDWQQGTVDATTGDAPLGSAFEPRSRPELTGLAQRFPGLYDRLPALFGVVRGDSTNSAELHHHSKRRRILSQVPTNAPTIPGFEIRAELGRGGMGVVYEARQICLNRVVALKLIAAGAHAGSEELARFRFEAEAAARLQHSNIVQVFEVGKWDDSPYLALELVDGGSLGQKLNGTPLPPQQAAQLVVQVARAMSYAHQRGIVHRDLKPANILLTSSGIPKIADFGLAKRLDAEIVKTRSGMVMGTPSYMAPEQAEGKSKEVGPATDVYALGAILYELLTGRPPFRAATLLETLEQVRSEDPVPPRLFQRQLPRDLEAICLKCLEKVPCQRFLSAQALADDLDRFLAGESTQTRSVNLFERVSRLVDHTPVRSRPASTNLYPYLVPVPLLLQFLLFLAAGAKPFYAVASLGVAVLCVILGLVAETGSRSVRPSGLSAADMRHFWSAHIGFLLGVVILPIVSYMTAPTGARWNPLTVFPLWAVLAGVSFFYLASIIWGRLYLLGLIMFAVAPLMALRLEWSPVLAGLVHSALFGFSAVHTHRIRPSEEPEANNERL